MIKSIQIVCITNKVTHLGDIDDNRQEQQKIDKKDIWGNFSKTWRAEQKYCRA